MDFFGIGALELVLILIVLLIVVPPSKLPEVARTIGKGVRKFKELTAEISKDIKEMSDEAKEAGKEGVDATGPRDGFADIISDVQKDLREVSRDINISLKPGGEVAKELKGLVGNVTGEKMGNSKVIDGGIRSINNTSVVKDESQWQDSSNILKNNTEKKNDV